MKRILSLLLSALIMMSLFAVSFTARAEQIYNWTVKVNTTRTECYITGYTGNTYIRHVMIPSFLDGMAVIDVAMPMKKFPNLANLVFYDDTIMTVTPNCKGCSDLEKVTILDHNDTSRVVSENKLPESIKNVTYDAFAGTSIRELEMPGVETIGRAYSDGAFEDCDNLGKVTIRKPARIFADSFAKIDCVCDIDYNGPVSEWTCEAVRYSPNLKANCNDGWFGWCGDAWDGTGYPSERSNLYWKLTKEGALTVDSLYGTESLEKQTVKTHRWNAFQVTSLSLNHVYNTGKETFRYVAIPTLELPSTVNTIGDYSFANCGKLSEVHIPKSVKTIGNYAFAYCGNLKDIYYDGTWDEWNSVTKKQGWKSGTPSDVKIHCKSTVNFDANGHGKAPASQTGLVSYTDKVVEPNAPSEHQYEFLGWYKEPDCINKWDFDKDIVTDDMTLFAKWKRVMFNINVTGNEGGNPTADKNEAYENTLIHLNPNTLEGWVFKGWQVESDNANIQSDTFKMPAEDVTVKALYEQVKNGINVVSTPGGTAIADKDTAANGETVNLTATPDAGWKFKEWEVVTGGVDVTENENASFVMSNQPNVVIRAVFERITYKLTIHTNGNGVVDTGYDTNEIPEGWDVSLNAYPDDGYRLKNLYFMTEGVDFRYPYVFSMPGFATDVYAEFEPIPISKVSTNSTGNGTIQADKNSAKSGENVYITVTPDEGNRLKSINVTTGNTELWIDEGGYGFSMPDDDVVVSAVFEEIPPTHQLNGEGVLFFDTGINKITEAEAGSDVTVSIDDTQIPDGYYFTKSYLANDVDINVEDTSDGTFVMPAHDVTVTPVFAEREDGELDLTGEEAVVLPEKDLAGLLTASEFVGYDDQRNLYYFDFNEDGTPDVWLDCDNNTVQRAEGAASADKNYTIPVDYLIPPRFKSLKFIFASDPVVETYEVKTIAEEGGTVSEGALYEKGATATVTATPNEGYEFDGWYENGEKVSSDASYSFEVTKYTQLVAKFSEKTSDPVVETYEVKTIAEEGGTVSEGALYEKGATATVTATPNEGYEFDGWYENGEKVSSDASYSFKVTKYTQLVAKFSEKTSDPVVETYEVKTIAEEGGTVSEGALYEKGATATVTATPNEGYEFDGWYENGEKVSSEASYSFEVTKYTQLVAKFSEKASDPVVETYEVKTIAEEGGTVSEGALYEKGATATVTATPNEGYEFDGWYENGEKVSSDASYSFEVTKHMQLVAKFSEKTSDPVVETYEVKTIAEEGGTVSAGALYEKGATATVTATPNEGYEFDGWYENGEKVSSDASYSFEVTKYTQLVAKFSEKIVVNRITVSNGKFTYNTGLKKITITVYDRYEKPLSGKTVTVIMNSKKSTFTTNADGKITYSFNTVIKPNTYTVKASCEGVNGSSKVVINKAKPKLSARKKTFKKNSKAKKYTVKLKDNKGKAIKKAKITIKIKGKTYKATTNAKGVATFKFKKLKKKGSYKATVKFAGNGYFTAVSKKVKIKIK